MKTLKDYMEMNGLVTDLLGLQDLISKMIDIKGVEETLYAIAIGLENSSYARQLDNIINSLLNFSKQATMESIDTEPGKPGVPKEKVFKELAQLYRDAEKAEKNNDKDLSSINKKIRDIRQALKKAPFSMTNNHINKCLGNYIDTEKF